jgi:hypothetical protein
MVLLFRFSYMGVFVCRKLHASTVRDIEAMGGTFGEIAEPSSVIPVMGADEK